MTAAIIVWLCKLGGLALLGWGAWLCIARRDRRWGRDRRGEGRGGRRSADARAAAPASAAAIPQEQRERLVA
ncbi:MAG TPA: hypothetical protein VHL85_08930 [Burkholderiales bacterium]|jgi:hypothetical protein|nr:hypothetical protein [Burkholderiales bacterium]